MAPEASQTSAGHGSSALAGAAFSGLGAVELVATGEGQQGQQKRALHGSRLNRFLLVVNLALVAGACEDGSDLEQRQQALWVNPAASACIGEQPAMTVRLFRYNDGGPCLQFGSNIEINNLGLYTWSDGSNLNDNVGAAIGNVWGYPQKTQRVTVWWDWMFGGPSASHQVTYTGQPGGGYNVWLYNPWSFTFGASSLRYEVW
jgi:hypothetical protein